MADMPRIGRRARPGEATMQLVREHPDRLDHMAWLLWTDTVKLGHTTASRERWEAMSEQDREVWRDRCFAQLAEETAEYDRNNPEPPDDDPDGGLPLPIERIA